MAKYEATNVVSSLREYNSELYEAFVKQKGYTEAELESVASDPDKIKEFVASFKKYMEESAESKEGEEILDNVIAEEVQNPAETTTPTPAEAAAELEKNIDPFRWEEFYAPESTEVINRANAILDDLASETGEAYTQTPEYKKNDSKVDEALNGAIDLSAIRRLAISGEQDITLENYNQARKQEKIRVETEYYNAMYGYLHGEQALAEESSDAFLRLAAIERMINDEASEAEIYEVLHIMPTAKAKASIVSAINRTNAMTLRIWGDLTSKHTIKNAAHKFGRFMDTLQKFESKNPIFGAGANVLLAGNPYYMAYRMTLASRAVYNDFQGFKDYASFKEIFRGDAAKMGLHSYLSQNKDSKVTEQDYALVKKYIDYPNYRSAAGDKAIGEEEYNKLKDFQKKAEFSRADFEQIKNAAATMSYDQYVVQAGVSAVDKQVFANVQNYVAVRKVQNYAEYLKDMKKAKLVPISESEYNRYKIASGRVAKVNLGQMLRDKKTRNDLLNHTVIFARSLPVVGQVYGVGMAAKNFLKKDYWKSLNNKRKRGGKAFVALAKSGFKDKKAWKDFYDDGVGFAADVIGMGMLASGIHGMASHPESIIPDWMRGNETAPALAANPAVVSAQQDAVSRQPFDFAAEQARVIEENSFEPEGQVTDGQEMTESLDSQEESSAEEILESVTANEMTPVQAQRLFDAFPRGMTLILEGNMAPEVADAPVGEVLSSATLAEMWPDLSAEQQQAAADLYDRMFYEDGRIKDPDLLAEYLGHGQSHDHAHDVSDNLANAENNTGTNNNEAKDETVKDADSVVKASDDRLSDSNSISGNGTYHEDLAAWDTNVVSMLDDANSHNRHDNDSNGSQIGNRGLGMEDQNGREEYRETYQHHHRYDDHGAEHDDAIRSHRAQGQGFVGRYKISIVSGEGLTTLPDGDVVIRDPEIAVKLSAIDMRIANSELLHLLRESQEGNTAVNGEIVGSSFHNTRVGIENMAVRLTTYNAIYEDLLDKVDRGYVTTEAEHQFMGQHEDNLARLGLERDGNHWAKAEREIVETMPNVATPVENEVGLRGEELSFVAAIKNDEPVLTDSWVEGRAELNGQDIGVKYYVDEDGDISKASYTITHEDGGRVMISETNEGTRINHVNAEGQLIERTSSDRPVFEVVKDIVGTERETTSATAERPTVLLHDRPSAKSR